MNSRGDDHWAIRILRVFCPPSLLEEIEGDLLQKFFKNEKLYGTSRANWRLFWSVVRFFRPGIVLRNDFTLKFHGVFIVRNYLTTTVRMLRRNKGYSAVTIFGLSIGIASAILILLWVQYEYSYNHFASNYKKVYQVKVNFTHDGTVTTEEDNCVPVYKALRDADSRIENTCITSATYGHSIDYKDKKAGKEVLAVSKEFLEMFGIPIIKGSVHSLDDPYSIMLNESTAKELFGDKDPINQFITYDHKNEMKVTGVFKDIPYNSTFWFHALVPGLNERFSPDKDKWDSFYPKIYAVLRPGSEKEEVNHNIRDLVKQHFNDGSNPELFLQAMDRWYLHDKFANGQEAGGKIEYVRLFTWIAVLILIIACINYMNLSTARSERRAKEVGIRKSIGSKKSDLVQQFLLESFFITGISFVLSIIMAKLCLPWYNNLVHSKLSIDLAAPEFWILSLAVVGITALTSGWYPAFYFSSFQPIKVLKNNIHFRKSAVLPRNIMVTAQYVISIFLIMGMIVVYQQIQHVKNRDLGYDQSNLVCVAFNDQIEKNYAAIKYELLNSRAVESVTKSNEGIDVDFFNDYVEWVGKTGGGKIQFSRISTEYDYCKTNGIRILEGRDFSPNFKSDINAVLINRTAAKIMGIKSPIGQKIKTRDRELTIIGVIEDVVRGRPFDPVAPCYVGMLEDGNNHLTLRLAKTNNLKGSLSKIDSVFKKLDPLNIDEPQFVSDRFAWNYRTMNFVGELANLFAFLGILLTGLGVLGLAAFTAEQRMKELAIRKILGAGLSNLLLLLNNYFVRVVLVALLIAAPVTWLALSDYLESYSYRISIPWWVIPTTAVGFLVFTFLVVSLQVLKAASANPVNALKND